MEEIVMAVTQGPWPNSAPAYQANVPNGTDIDAVRDTVLEMIAERHPLIGWFLRGRFYASGFDIAARILHKRYPPAP
jgi:hypothetical protein